MAKRYYWLKLMDDFFTQPRMKKLRRIAGGDTYTIIYLKMMLLSINDGGKLYFEGVEDNFIDDLALRIDEASDNVKFTVLFLLNQGLMECVQEGEEYLLHEAVNSIGSETDKAAMMRNLRNNRKSLESGNNVTPQLPGVTESYTDIDRDRDTNTEKEEKDNSSIPAGTDKRKPSKPRKKSVSKTECETAFEEIWAMYPKARKQGKANAYKAFEKAIKDGETLDRIKAGLTAAINHWKATKTESQFIPMGSTWFNQQRWSDEYGEEQHGQDKKELGSRFGIDIMG